MLSNIFKHNTLAIAVKIAIFLVVLAIIFSPFGNPLPNPLTQAATVCIGAGPTFHPPLATGGCPPGTLAQEADDETANKLTSTDNLCNSIGSCVALIVYVFTAGLGSFVAFIASYFFNVATQLSLNSTAYGLNFVTTGWEAVRDIANMFFILILVYIAITIMLAADTGGTMKTLAWVIFIALIINFSFFVTRLVIDVGNIAAVQFYNEIPAATLSDNRTVDTTAGIKDITASLMNAIGVQKILGDEAFNFFQDNTNGFTEFITLVVIYLFMGAIYFMIAAAFLAAGIKFVIRIAVLWLVIIASPLALVASTMERFRGYYTLWQSTLISHTLYPVVFLFIFLIITVLAQDIDLKQAFITYVNTSPDTYADSLLNLGVLIGDVIIRLAFVVIMLYFGLRAADQIGVIGANMAQRITAAIPGFGGLSSYRRLGGVYSKYTPFLGPGRVAGSLDQALQRSQFGNSALGYELRRYVTKPIAGTRFGGAESRSELIARQKTEKRERTDNLRDVENRERVGRIAAVIDDNIKSGKPAAEGISDEDKKRIQSLNQRELGATKAEHLVSIAPLLTEDQSKKINDLANLTDAQKEAAISGWNEHSGTSPLHKANDEINALRKINETLLKDGVTLTEINDKIGTVTSPRHAVINKEMADRMSGAVGKKIDELRAVVSQEPNINRELRDVKERLKDFSTKAVDNMKTDELKRFNDLNARQAELEGLKVEIVNHRQTIRSLDKASKNLESLEKHLGNIHAGVGGTKESRTFDTSKVS
ncbi:MAG TPA: hypothetical protein VD928_02050 [Candidatus Paceibacterota bacterium]|nr:hypothetical protein [Candidatus Paceibacterota bacterium]